MTNDGMAKEVRSRNGEGWLGAWLRFGSTVVRHFAAGGLIFGGAVSGQNLRTLSYADQLLKQADTYVAQKRYPLAAQLWQSVIDSSRDAVVESVDEGTNTVDRPYRIFRPQLDAVESTIAKQPIEALRAYRLRADGNARGLLNGAKSAGERENALAMIVKRYFLSSEGDEAAMELAALKMDRFEFSGASMLLRKLLDRYPDPTVDTALVRMRLAVAEGKLGRRAAAEELLDALAEGSGLPARVLAEVRAGLADGAAPAEAVAEVGAWSMQGGSPARCSVMPALPAGKLRDFKKVWEQPYTLDVPEGLRDQVPLRTFADEPELARQWMNMAWRPLGGIRFGDEGLWFKNDERSVLVRPEDGRFRGMTYRSGYKALGVQQPQVAGRFGAVANPTPGPRTAAEAQIFVDHRYGAALRHGNRLYVIEQPAADAAAAPNARRPQPLVRPAVPAMQTRQRRNVLAAYPVDPLRERLWAVSAASQPALESTSCFLGEPLAYGGLLLVPALANMNVVLQARDLDTGKLVWSTQIVDEPRSATQPNADVAITLAEGTVFVLPGAGVVSALDAGSGSLKWTVQYERAERSSIDSWRRTIRSVYGWEDNQIAVRNGSVVFCGSDYDMIAVLDAETGAPKWEATMRNIFTSDVGTPYLIGVTDKQVIVGGHSSVLCYKLEGGKLDREIVSLESYGRALLTTDELLVPNQFEVLRIDPLSGEVKERADLTDPLPVGSLFSDGERLYNMTPRKLEAYAPAAEE